MNIDRVLFAPGNTGFFFDDQRAIKRGAVHDGFVYEGKPLTGGFSSVRQAGECVSIMLVLEDGQVAIGDAAAVQYSGAGGRDPLFLADDYLPFLKKTIAPALEGREIDTFRSLAKEFDELTVKGKHVHTAIRYGVSQALLDARAKATRKTMTDVVCEEYNLPLITRPVPIFGQTGDDRHNGVDKMILKNVDVLPHGLINNIDEKLGRGGELLRDYVVWLVKRVRKLRRDTSYRPTFHIDVYGNVGPIFGHDPDRIADYLADLQDVADEFPLYIEGPIDMEAREPQIAALKDIKDALKRKGAAVKIVADEWCNTLEDIMAFRDADCCHMAQIKTPDLGSVHNVVESVLLCRETGMEAYQGGTCNETDASARCCVHLALAARPERMLAKPGMGFDEGFAIVKNEMERTLALLRNKA